MHVQRRALASEPEQIPSRSAQPPTFLGLIDAFFPLQMPPGKWEEAPGPDGQEGAQETFLWSLGSAQELQDSSLSPELGIEDAQ